MSWHYRDPMTFPAAWHNAILSAARHSPNPSVLCEVIDRAEAKARQSEFLWFKWCCRHERSAATETRRALEAYDFRCTLEQPLVGRFVLYLRARPTLLADLINLNPEIANELSAIVNP